MTTFKNCTFGSEARPKMTLNELADALLELKRYVKPDPEYVRSEIEKPVTRVRNVDAVHFAIRQRITANLYIGLAYIHADPEVLESYLYAAAFEIRAAALREENAK